MFFFFWQIKNYNIPMYEHIFENTTNISEPWCTYNRNDWASEERIIYRKNSKYWDTQTSYRSCP